MVILLVVLASMVDKLVGTVGISSYHHPVTPVVLKKVFLIFKKEKYEGFALFCKFINRCHDFKTVKDIHMKPNY